MILKNIIISVRRLKKHKLHAFLGVLGFSAGFTICLTIGLYVYGEYTTDTYAKNHKQIFRIFETESNSSIIDYRVNKFLKDKFPSIKSTCPVYVSLRSDPVLYTDKGSMYVKEEIITTTNNFFDLFSIPIIKSISDEAFADKKSSVITESISKQVFGDINPLGKRLKVDHNETIVSAVIKDFPKNSRISGGVLLNAENSRFSLIRGRRGKGKKLLTFTNIYVLLDKEESPKELENLINTSIKGSLKTVSEIALQPLQDIYFNTEIKDHNKHGNKNLMIILSVIGVGILLLSVINYVNYIISLQLKRMKEVGIKKVNGATRFHIIASYLTDVSLWLFISFISSLILVQIFVPYFNQLFQEALNLKVLYTPIFMISIIVVLMGVFFVSSLPIILLLVRFNIQNFLKGKIHKNQKSFSRSILPVFQLSIAVLLIISTMVIHNQISYAKHLDLGFNKEELLYVEIPYKSLNSILFKQELLKNPSIKSVTVSGIISKRRSSAVENDYTLNYLGIDEDFLKTMQIPLLKGRNVFKNDKQACIVNEATIKALKLESFKGEKVRYFNKEIEIVGVVKDFYCGSIHQKIEPLVMKYEKRRDVSLRVDTENLSETMEYISNTWKKLASETPFKYEFYDATFDAMYKKEEKLANACTLFSIIAIVITCLGLLGQILFIADKKTKEIGVRKVNGATTSEIIIMLNKDFIKWVIIAFIIACPIAYYAMNKWLENFAYKTNLSWWIFALAGLFTLLIALLTVSWQSYRAATQNPVESLRDE